MPRTKKPAGTAVDKRNGRRAEVTAAGQLQRLKAPANLCHRAKLDWEAFWDDAVSRAPSGVDRTVVLRWITSLDRYYRTIGEADKKPMMLGSTGQHVANPLYKIAEQSLAVAERCEKQLGVGAKNRADLGIAIVTEAKSLADMNSRYEEEPDGGDNDEGEADPRLTVVEGEVV